MALALAMRARALLASKKGSKVAAPVRLPVTPAPSAPRAFLPFLPYRFNQPVAVATTGRVITPRPAIATIIREPLVSAVREPVPQFMVERPAQPLPVVATEPAALPPVKFTTCSDCGAPVTEELHTAAPAPAAGGIDASTTAATDIKPAAPGGAPTPPAADRKSSVKGLLMFAGVAALIAVLLITAAAVRPK